MNRIVGIAVLVVGLVLIGWGISASDSVGSGFSRIFTGAPTNKTVYFLIGGGLLIATGLGSVFYPSSRKTV